MKVSVIVPIYNVESYLRQCLDSILSQTYTNLEIILVNDGSTDSSGRICEEYRLSDSRVKVIYQKNQGVSAARNKGLDMATGDFIFFVDSDDWLPSECIERLYHQWEETASDVVVANYIIFNDETASFQFHIVDEQYFVKTYSTQEYVVNRYNLEFQLGYCFLFIWGTLYKKELFDYLRYPVGKLEEDNYTSYKLFLLASNITFINQSNYVRRERPGSLASQLGQDGEFPIQTLEQRIALLATLGYDYSADIENYKALLVRGREIALGKGDFLAYKENCLKLELIEKHGKK